MMTSAIVGIIVAAIVLSATTQSSQPVLPDQARAPTQSQIQSETTVFTAGLRVESDSYAVPSEAARCIAYNIARKMPELRVRRNAGEGAEESHYLIVTALDPVPATFGVIRVERSEAGSRLTTWLPGTTLSAVPEDIARRLVAGC